MSNNVFPELPGLRPNLQRTVMAPTVEIRTTPSLREYRARNSALPRYLYRLSFEVLRTTAALPELQQLVGFFNTQGGPFDSFLIRDPVDYTVTDEPIGTGNGTRTVFELVRAMGGHTESVPYIGATNAITNVKIAGTPTTSYTHAGGVITFASAPASGSITWTGTYYRRVRFRSDNLALEQLLGDLWQGQSVELISVKA